MDITGFWTICSANGIVFSKEQLKSFERFAGELVYWNSKVNLISRKDEELVFEKHILHSITIQKYFDFKPKMKLLDVGTGGGLPGIPLKISNPDINITLLDSISKKVKVTKMLAQHTGLNNIDAVRKRAEEMNREKKYFQYFDVIVSRAVTRIDKIMNWTNNLLKKNGSYIFLKGGKLDGEIKKANDGFNDFEISVHNIEFTGAEWFKNDDKKVVIFKRK